MAVRKKRRSSVAPRPMAEARCEYHHGNLRRALVDAALKLIKTAGPGALTLRAAARLAGVSQAAPYRHFASKEALLAAVAEEGFRTMSALHRHAMAAYPQDPVARLDACGLSYIDFAFRHPSHFTVMFGPEVADKSSYPSLKAAAKETFAILLGALADCREAGLLRPGDLKELALATWSLAHGLASLLVNGQLSHAAGDLPVGQLARRVLQSNPCGLISPAAVAVTATGRQAQPSSPTEQGDAT